MNTENDTPDLAEIPLKTVAEQWEDFRQSTMPHVTDEIQIEEMRRGYFSGFFSGLVSMSNMASGPRTEDEGAAEIEKWMNECTQFFHELTVEHYGERPPKH